MATTAPPTAVVVPTPAAPASATNALTLHDVKPPVPIPTPWRDALLTLALVLLVASVVALFLRRRRRVNPAPAIVVPPHRRAREALLAALDLLHDPKPFTTRVADTLRIYLEERFDLHAPERTSEEFFVELSASPDLSPPQKEVLNDFLARCDLVKFARLEPTETELRGLWDTALRLVEDTSPLAPPAPNSQLPTPNS